MQALADSISAVGLLHPIVIRSDKTLVAGARRLAALELLGESEASVHVVDGLEYALALLKAERDENTCRKDFTPLEMVAMGKALEALEKPKAKERQQEHGKTAPGKAKNTPGNFPEVNGRTREHVAEAVGVSDRTYEKAKAVAEAAETDPNRFADLAEKMDRTGKVDGAYKAMRKRQAPEPPITTRAKDDNGRAIQRTLWKLVNESPREFLVASFEQRRSGIVADVRSLRRDLDYANSTLRERGKREIQLDLDNLASDEENPEEAA